MTGRHAKGIYSRSFSKPVTSISAGGTAFQDVVQHAQDPNREALTRPQPSPLSFEVCFWIQPRNACLGIFLTSCREHRVGIVDVPNTHRTFLGEMPKSANLAIIRWRTYSSVSMSRNFSAVGWIQICLHCLRIQDLCKEAGNIDEANYR